MSAKSTLLKEKRPPSTDQSIDKLKEKVLKLHDQDNQLDARSHYIAKETDEE